MEIEGIIPIKIEGQIVAMVYNDMKKHSQVFFSCKEMNQDDVKELLTLIGSQPTAEK